MSKEKLYRNKDGEYLYLFNWIGGGIKRDYLEIRSNLKNKDLNLWHLF